jgi:MSHA biogenesis protein MshI
VTISIPWFKKSSANAGRLGISVGPDGLAIAFINRSGELAFYQFYGEPGDSQQLLADLVVEHSWQNTPCSLVLHPIYYQLLLTESPAVEASELQTAVRWKVKELLDFPLEEAAIEYFLLPDDAYRGRQKMLYAAVLRKSTLKSLVEPVEAAGLNVDCVEITELALHNIVSRFPADTGGLAVIQLNESDGFINLLEGGEIYLCRRLDVGLDQYFSGNDPQVFYDALLLTIQRSLDYYESQLGKGIITTIYFSPCSSTMQPVIDFVESQLGLTVAALPLTQLDIMSECESGDEELSRCVSAIGAAMQPRVEVASATTH